MRPMMMVAPPVLLLAAAVLTTCEPRVRARSARVAPAAAMVDPSVAAAAPKTSRMASVRGDVEALTPAAGILSPDSDESRVLFEFDELANEDMEGLQTLSGIVLLDGQWPVQTMVYIHGTGQTRGTRSVQSDADGHFRFKHLFEGRVYFDMGHGDPDYRVREHVIVPTNSKNVVVRVARSVTVTGSIVPPPGHQLGDVDMMLWSHVSSQDGYLRSSRDGLPRIDGRKFHVGDLARGYSTHLCVWGTCANGQSFVPRFVRFRASAVPLVIRLSMGHTVTGRILTRDGEPVSDAVVSALHPDLAPWGVAGIGVNTSTRTDERGQFRLTGIRSEGVWIDVLDLSLPPGYGIVGALPFVRGPCDLKLVVDKDQRITARVSDPRGQSVEGIWVTCWFGSMTSLRARAFGPSSSPNAFDWNRGKVSPDGAATISWASPGRYTLYAWNVVDPTDGRFAVEHGVQAGGPEVHLSLRQGRTVAGTVRLPGGELAQAIDVRMSGRWGVRQMTTDKSGRFRFAGIPPGSCLLEARDRKSILPQFSAPKRSVEAGQGLIDIILRAH